MDQREPYDSSRSQQSRDENASRKQPQHRHSYEGEKLPGDPLAITLGIVSLVFFFIFCWCYGVIAIITLIISIIGWIQANNSIAMYHNEPDRYSYDTLRSVQNARVINMVGAILSGLVTLIMLILMLFFGTIFYQVIDGDWENLRNLNNDDYLEESYDDSLEQSTEDWQYNEVDADTVIRQVDSTTYQIEGIPGEN